MKQNSEQSDENNLFKKMKINNPVLFRLKISSFNNYQI